MVEPHGFEVMAATPAAPLPPSVKLGPALLKPFAAFPAASKVAGETEPDR